MQPISPKKVRFIKLGKGGIWAKTCIEENTIRLGYDSPHHQDCLEKQWDLVRNYWLVFRNHNERAATNDCNQIRDFYELSESDLWITFHTKKLYWCVASAHVEKLVDGTRIRRTIGTWQSTDILGQPLRIENIDGRVTKVQGYKGTICSIELQDYLIRKINAQPIDEVNVAKASLQKLKIDVEDLIKGLWWHDFELLIDLVFSKSGWHRFSVLGKTEKDIDLEIYSATTQKRAFVQIKSATCRTELEDYIKETLIKSTPLVAKTL
jgi:hypothetical protein